jgi:hypothetical protein
MAPTMNVTGNAVIPIELATFDPLASPVLVQTAYPSGDLPCCGAAPADCPPVPANSEVITAWAPIPVEAQREVQVRAAVFNGSGSIAGVTPKAYNVAIYAVHSQFSVR